MNNLFFRLLASFAIGFFFIWWIFRNIEMNELKQLSSRVDLRIVCMGISFYTCAILLRIYRWKGLLASFAPLTFLQVGRALVVGYAMNIILPARLGELFRVNICKKWYEVPRSVALATIVWERTADGIIVLCCLAIGAVSLNNFSHQREIQMLMWMGSFLFAGIVLTLLILRNISLDRLLSRWPILLIRLRIFQKGIQDFRPTALVRTMGISALVWIFEGLSLWSIVKASGAVLSGLHVSLLIGIVSLSTLLPSPPGFLGTMQFAFAIAVTAAGCTAAVGVLAAMMNQIFLLGGLTLFGMVVFCSVLLKNKILHLRKS